jgi:hypothetical protein
MSTRPRLPSFSGLASRFARVRRYQRLALITLACFGCSGIEGACSIETPPEPASGVYPTVAGDCACGLAPAAAHWFDRVLIIVLENQDCHAAIANPYLDQLAREGALFTDYHAPFHPSYPNYLAMVAGRDTITTGDWQQDLNECTIANLLQSKGLTWKAYAEGYPGQSGASGHSEQCISADAIGTYARKHVPFRASCRFGDINAATSWPPASSLPTPSTRSCRTTHSIRQTWTTTDTIPACPTPRPGYEDFCSRCYAMPT